jgi:hypothetical protein
LYPIQCVEQAESGDRAGNGERFACYWISCVFERCFSGFGLFVPTARETASGSDSPLCEGLGDKRRKADGEYPTDSSFGGSATGIPNFQVNDNDNDERRINRERTHRAHRNGLVCLKASSLCSLRSFVVKKKPFAVVAVSVNCPRFPRFPW